MDFQFYKVEQDLNFLIHNLVHSKDKRVFKSRRLTKDDYKLRSPNQLFDDIRNFLNKRVEDCKNNQGYISNTFIIKIYFFSLPEVIDNAVDFQLFTAKFNENGLKSFTTYEEFFNEHFFINMENNNCYNIFVTEILKYLTPAGSDTDDGEEEDITIVQNYECVNGKKPIVKTFSENKCVVCLNNKPNILYENCKHIPTCSNCEEIKNLNNCPVCRSVTLKYLI